MKRNKLCRIGGIPARRGAMLHEEFAAQRDNQSRAHSLPH